MTRRLIVAALVATVFSASPASADWGPTHWGDTLSATAATTNARTLEGREGESVYDNDYRAVAAGTFDGMPVIERFYFDKRGGLATVKLVPIDPHLCADFVALVRKHYGTPRVEAIPPQLRKLGTIISESWSDVKADLAIRVFSIERPDAAELSYSCHLTYQSFGNGRPGVRSDAPAI